MTHTTKSFKETEELAQEFVSSIVPLENQAKVMGLRGELGAGKTAFVKCIAKALKIKETVTSPTFIIEKIYSLPKENKFKKLIHIDAYRLSGGEDLLSIGWEEILNNPENLIFIEWPERVENILPKEIQNIQFEFVDDSTRMISL